MTALGELAIVLHTHMPYVEGFGTWPFGEEWLWEAIATSYLPLLPILGRAPLTLSLTPVLCDQLESPTAMARCLRFLREVRPETHARDIASLRGAGEPELVAELERSAAEYAAAADRLETLDGGLLAALAPHASWTCSATHAVLPLMATNSGINLQVQTGIAAHRRRFGEWGGGFWLPECAYAPCLDVPLSEAGARAVCVELTHCCGTGDPRHLHPQATEDGPLLWPIDRETIARVWSAQGYPSRGAYRAYHRLTEHHHRVWAVDGRPYDPLRGTAQARADAVDFVHHVRSRVASGGVCVCALDTELLGHWWYEGVQWLAAVIEEAARQDLPLTSLDEARERHDPVPAPAGLGVSSWGEGGDLRTWSGPAVADLAWQARSAELLLLARAPVGATRERALRELLALQASDWAFLETRRLAGTYGRDRAAGHRAELERAMRGARGGPARSAGGSQPSGGPHVTPELRHLAPILAGWDV